MAMTMDRKTTHALDTLAQGSRRLRAEWHFEWPAAIQQANHRLRFGGLQSKVPIVVAVVGGASSGKSTVFKNLL